VSIITREDYEAQEHVRLQSRAAFADSTRGRVRPLPLDPYRTEFQRDRDRIIHCKAFRRLSHKTQVFLAPEGDHYRTRLTHTLEVAQIARSIARALRLNEDLTEAIALAHDLGHTPFGHKGEDALSECLSEIAVRYPGAGLPGRFEHNLQSLRIVEHLEYEGKGLNLTWEVRDGIEHHTGSGRAATLEGQVVATADRIAYVNHDIDDAMRGGLVQEEDLPQGPTDVLGHNHGARIMTMVTSMVESSHDSEEIGMSPEVWDAMMDLRQFLFDRVYLSGEAKAEEPKAYRVVRSLFDHYLKHPDDLPPEYRLVAEADGAKGADGAGGQGGAKVAGTLDAATTARLAQAVTDYIAGMTDRFAIRMFQRLFVPSAWRV